MKRIIVFFLFLFVAQAVHSQSLFNRNTVSLVPLNLINGGLRIDFEHQIGENSRNWILLGPQYYYKDVTEYESMNFGDFDELEFRGMGLELAYKHLLEEAGFSGNAYYLVGVSFQYFDIKNEDKINPGSILLQKTGAHFIIGYQMKTKERINIDLFTGLGFRYTLEEANDMKNDFSELSWNLGYTGPAFLLGVKIGIIL